MFDDIKLRNNFRTQGYYIAISHEPLARQGFRCAEANVREVEMGKQIIFQRTLNKGGEHQNKDGEASGNECKTLSKQGLPKNILPTEID